MKATFYNVEMDIQPGPSDRQRREEDQVNSPSAADEREFPTDGTREEQFEYLLRFVILAPSTYNTQPWKFQVAPDGIGIFADYGRRMPVADPGNRELLISIGAAIMNLRVAAAHFGFSCRVHYNYSGESERPIAFAALSPADPGERDGDLDALFPSIPGRHTNRSPFLLSRIPAAVLNNLTALGMDGRASLAISTDGKLNSEVADLVATADRRQYADSALRQERAEWIRPNWTMKPDGLPGAALGLKGVAAALGPWTTRVLDLGKVRAARDKNLCIEAPGLVVVHSEESIPHWLEAGELLERLLLGLVREGLQSSYFNMPVQVPELRVQLRALLGIPTWPQILLRIGYCLVEPAITPRRPVAEVLMKRIMS